MPITKLTAEIITAAIQGFEFQKTSIDAKIAELRAMLPGSSKENAAALQAPERKRRRFSAAGRKRMRDAQRLRWAKVRGSASVTAEPAKPKRKLSAAAKAKLVANLKKARAAKAAKAKAAGK